MQTAQVHLRKKDMSQSDIQSLIELNPNLVIAFGDVDWISDQVFMEDLRGKLGKVEFVGCSTSGEISNKGLFDGSMVLTAIKFDSVSSKVKSIVQKVGTDQLQTGRDLGKAANGQDLVAIFLLAPGLTVQGSSLLHGLKEIIEQVPMVSGGLAGDNGKFKRTVVFKDDKVFDDHVVAVAFYGARLKMKHSARAGFRSFGGVRQITKAKENIVFEIDNEPALKVYKQLLGKHAEELPATGLMFPFAMLNNQLSETGLIRAVLNIDEPAQSLVLAGDVQSGTFFKLMRGENQSLIAGAKEAAEVVAADVPPNSLAFLVSCIARRMVMGEAVEDEIEAAIGELSNCKNVAGFYAYGEFGPFFTQGDCQLHNQTMTISILSETAG